MLSEAFVRSTAWVWAPTRGWMASEPERDAQRLQLPPHWGSLPTACPRGESWPAACPTQGVLACRMPHAGIPWPAACPRGDSYVATAQ
jgi:hypothetical protein